VIPLTACGRLVPVSPNARSNTRVTADQVNYTCHNASSSSGAVSLILDMSPSLSANDRTDRFRCHPKFSPEVSKRDATFRVSCTNCFNGINRQLAPGSSLPSGPLSSRYASTTDVDTNTMKQLPNHTSAHPVFPSKRSLVNITGFETLDKRLFVENRQQASSRSTMLPGRFAREKRQM
jgi:hypothetical protein